MDLILAISYGGRQEIVDAIKSIASQILTGSLDSDAINEDVVRNYLYAPDVPDPDLLIRSSNEFRISNFLLWQLAYSEIVLSKKSWPAFDRFELFHCFNQFALRKRRFGCTEEQIANRKKKSNTVRVTGSEGSDISVVGEEQSILASNMVASDTELSSQIVFLDNLIKATN
jgi:undecaprenyl diphosphate synthase